MALKKPGHYETLVRVRKRQEEIKVITLAATRRDISNAEAERAGIAARQREALEQASEIAKSEFDASDVRRYYQYERYLARLAVRKDADIRGLQRKAEGQRRELLEATKKRRISEKLEERTAEAYHDHVLKQAQKQIDEVATNRAAMSQRETQERRRR